MTAPASLQFQPGFPVSPRVRNLKRKKKQHQFSFPLTPIGNLGITVGPYTKKP
jgi:hypothetical protein